MSRLEVIVSVTGRPAFTLYVEPGGKQALDELLRARRENRAAILYIDDPDVLDARAKAMVKRSLFGRASIRFPAGTIRTARLVD